jgi:hypothetical protein
MYGAARLELALTHKTKKRLTPTSASPLSSLSAHSLAQDWHSKMNKLVHIIAALALLFASS